MVGALLGRESEAREYVDRIRSYIDGIDERVARPDGAEYRRPMRIAGSIVLYSTATAIIGAAPESGVGVRHLSTAHGRAVERREDDKRRRRYRR